jgi:hypothetical protein
MSEQRPAVLHQAVISLIKGELVDYVQLWNTTLHIKMQCK